MNDDKGFGQKVTWDIPLLDGYDYLFMKNASSSKGMNTRFFDAINWSIFKVLRMSDDKIVIVNGWAYLSDWFVFIAAKLFGKKVWMRAEMPWNQEEMRPKSLKKTLKFLFFKYVFFKFFISKFLFIGTQNKKFYQAHGVIESRLIYAPYAVENDRLQSQKTLSNENRERWGISKDDFVILFSGKLIEKKRPLDLLFAFHQLDVENAVLFFMGDGPLRRELDEYITTFKLKRVIISGFINQSEIASIYSLADVFVMCSGIGETWGLSVNEAMNFSLPIIVSAVCGCSHDLIDDGDNGFIFNEGDVVTLKTHIDNLLQNKGMRLQMGQASKSKIVQFSHQITCDNIITRISKDKNFFG